MSKIQISKGIILLVLCSNICSAHTNFDKSSDSQLQITNQDNYTKITQSQQNISIDWKDFDISKNHTVEFVQPSSSSITVNRIHSNRASEIHGNLNANGNIVLINSHGLVFGKDSSINVNSFIATTSNISDENIFQGNFSFNSENSILGASIINEGTITAADAGLVGLVSPHITNNGVIRANLGKVEISSADKFTVDFYGNNLFEFAVENENVSRFIQNTGTIESAGGHINITAATGRKIVDNIIEISGELKTPSISEKNGKIIISAEGSNAVTNNISENKSLTNPKSKVIIHHANISTSSASSANGGDIEITADIINISSSEINSSANNNGGNILIGGDFQGKGTVKTSVSNNIAHDVTINSSANLSGNAGKVIIWSDLNTYFAGNIKATGGILSGDGGLVEVSGKQNLIFKGKVDTSSKFGKYGTLLLDPANITILDGNGDGDSDANDNSFTGFPSGVAGTVKDNDTGPTQIYLSEILGLSATNNISLSATNSITINTLTATLTANQDLTFNTGSGGFSMDPSNIISVNGDLSISTTGGSSVIGNIQGSGNVILNISGGSANINNLANTGTFTNIGSGNVTLNNNSGFVGNSIITDGAVIAAHDNAFGSGTINLNGGTLANDNSNRILANDINITANSTIEANADFTLNGVISSTTNNNLDISGNGTVSLTNNNTYQGNTIINNNTTLSIGNNNCFGSSVIDLNGGTIINDNNPYNIINNISISANSAIETINNVVFAGVISSTSSSHNLTINSSGAITLSNDNSFSGTVILSSGTVIIASSDQFGTGQLIFDGATINTFGNFIISNNITLNSSTNFIHTTILHLSGQISSNNSSYDINVNSGGTLQLSGNNTYQGDTYITNSFLIIDNNNAVGLGNIKLNNSTLINYTDISFSNNITVTNDVYIEARSPIILYGIISGGDSDSNVILYGDITFANTNIYMGNTVLLDDTSLSVTANYCLSANSTISTNTNSILNINSFTQNILSINALGTVNFGNNAIFTTTNQQIYTGLVTANNITFSSSNADDITMSNLSNSILGNINITFAGNVNLHNNVSTNLGSINANSLIVKSNGGNVIINAAINVSATNSNSILVITPHDFINNYGANAFNIDTSSYFLVYANNPYNSIINSLNGFFRYGCTYNAGSPSCGSNVNIPSNQSGFYFITNPTLTTSGITANNKIYDATTVATISGTPSLNGILNGDNITLDINNAEFNFVTKNVGNNINVNASGYSLNQNVGYILVQPTLTANIRPYTLNISGITAHNKFFDGNDSAQISGTPQINPRGTDQIFLINSPVAKFITPTIGNNKQVLVNGFVLSYNINDINVFDITKNYNLIQPTILFADIYGVRTKHDQHNPIPAEHYHVVQHFDIINKYHSSLVVSIPDRCIDTERKLEHEKKLLDSIDRKKCHHLYLQIFNYLTK